MNIWLGTSPKSTESAHDASERTVVERRWRSTYIASRRPSNTSLWTVFNTGQALACQPPTERSRIPERDLDFAAAVRTHIAREQNLTVRPEPLAPRPAPAS
jgi:hypothetical protein